MGYVLCGLMGYAVGSLNPAYIIGRRKGFDIRSRGSGNAGGSNALITMGKIIGAICILFDIFKAYTVVRLSVYLFRNLSWILPISSTSCILGHMFPLYMKVRGGKGLACLTGVVLAFDAKLFLILLLIEAVLVFSINYICVIPITASIAFPILYGFLTDDPIGAAILSVASVAILLKHVKNVRRIFQGKELRFSYLWNRKKEEERIQEDTSVDTDKK